MTDEPAIVETLGLLREQRDNNQAFSEAAVCDLLNGLERMIAVVGQEVWLAPEFQKFAEDVMTGMYPKLKGSVMTVSLVPDQGDVKFWVELGASIMMDKPLISVVLHEREIPEKLRAVSDEIVVAPDGLDDPAARERMEAAIGRVLDKLGLTKKAERDEGSAP